MWIFILFFDFLIVSVWKIVVGYFFRRIPWFGMVNVFYVFIGSTLPPLADMGHSGLLSSS